MNDSGRQKRSYHPPQLECFGPVVNFTTGGSGKKSEWELEKTMGMGMSMGMEECVRTSRSMMKNTQMC